MGDKKEMKFGDGLNGFGSSRLEGEIPREEKLTTNPVGSISVLELEKVLKFADDLKQFIEQTENKVLEINLLSKTGEYFPSDLQVSENLKKSFDAYLGNSSNSSVDYLKVKLSEYGLDCTYDDETGILKISTKIDSNEEME